MNNMDYATAKQTFKAMCRAHDLAFQYSDDPNAFRRGANQLADIRIYAERFLSRPDAVTIWNENVDASLVEDVRDQFYWKG